MPFTIIPMKTKFFHSYSLVLNVVPGKEQVLLSYTPTDSVNGAPVTAVSIYTRARHTLRVNKGQRGTVGFADLTGSVAAAGCRHSCELSQQCGRVSLRPSRT